MSRKPSPATELRRVKRDLKAATKDALEYRHLLRVAEGKATKAQQEAADWKRRFDMLLAREPITQAIGTPLDLTLNTLKGPVS